MTESPIEILKRESRYLRGTLAEEVKADVPGFSKDAEQLIKLHGLYQQKDRDRRGENPPPVLMLRGRIPGGRLDAPRYLAWDTLADRYGDGSLRLTPRQSIDLQRKRPGRSGGPAPTAGPGPGASTRRPARPLLRPGGARWPGRAGAGR